MNHCIVVGAGIIGMMSAHKLIQAGYRVTIIEQGEVGLQSSWAGGGILSPLHPWRYPPQAIALVEYSLKFYPDFIQILDSTTGIDSELIQSGAIFVDQESIVQGQGWAEQKHEAYERLDLALLSEMEPMLAGFQNAILFPQVLQLRTPRLLKALKKSLLANGVSIKTFESLQGLQVDDRKVKGIKTEQGVILGQTVVLCCGAWTGELLNRLKLQSVPTQPVRGQMLLFEAASYRLNHVVLNDRYYLIPRQDGKILVGSTMEYAGFSKITTDSGREELYQAALELMPCLAECKITHHWAGLRPGSPGGIPTIAKHPEIEGLYINAGHFRNGVAMAAGSACLLGDLVSGKKTGIDPQGYEIFTDTH